MCYINDCIENKKLFYLYIMHMNLNVIFIIIAVFYLFLHTRIMRRIIKKKLPTFQCYRETVERCRLFLFYEY